VEQSLVSKHMTADKRIKQIGDHHPHTRQRLSRRTILGRLVSRGVVGCEPTQQLRNRKPAAHEMVGVSNHRIPVSRVSPIFGPCHTTRIVALSPGNHVICLITMAPAHRRVSTRASNAEHARSISLENLKRLAPKYFRAITRSPCRVMIRSVSLHGREGPVMTLTTETAVAGLEFVAVHQSDPLAAPQLEGLAHEYSARYGGDAEQRHTELRAYPPADFEPPDGALIVAVANGVPVAGGAFRRYDTATAELKRIWTASAHRRQGYGKLVVAELERIALQRGYTRLYLTTGWRQPEAVALYLAAGYTPLYDPSLPSEEIGRHPFGKVLVCEGPG
jgi:GNAT superfamily N-acetyltransferase